MTLKSRFSQPIPSCSVPQWVFGSSNGPLPEKKAWIDADRPGTHYLTYAEGRLLAKRIAAGLIENGLKMGDRVLVFSKNSFLFPAFVMGIWMAGGIFTGANPGCVTRELVSQLADSEASIVVASPGSSLDVALEAVREIGLSSDRVFLFDTTKPDCPDLECPPTKGSRHWTELIASKESGEQFKWKEPQDAKNTTAAINYSSGTTGLPKGVEISHYNIVANGIAAVSFHRLCPDYSERIRRAASLCFLPMYHAFSQGYFISFFPYERIPVYVMPSFNFQQMLGYIEKYRITKLLAVPPILVLTSKHPLARQADLSSLDMVGSGAAPLAKDTQRELDGMIPNRDSMVRQGWGMTEVTCSAISWDPSKKSSPAVGELQPDCQAKLLDIQTGEEITQAQTPGELWVSGPTVMRGYWHNPTATAETVISDKDGIRWLRTGDIAYVDQYGPGALFYIVDRLKELIKVKGNQVPPAELESLLLEHENVADAAVIGVVIGGEEYPRAYIVKTNSDSTMTEEDIASWLADRVVRHKQLKGGVVFVDTIPKIPSGKVLRRALREQAKKELTAGEVRAKL